MSKDKNRPPWSEFVLAKIPYRYRPIVYRVIEFLGFEYRRFYDHTRPPENQISTYIVYPWTGWWSKLRGK